MGLQLTGMANICHPNPTNFHQTTKSVIQLQPAEPQRHIMREGGAICVDHMGTVELLTLNTGYAETPAVNIRVFSTFETSRDVCQTSDRLS